MLISTSTTVILTASAFFTAILGGMMGMAGGVLFLAVLASFVNVAYVVPLHSVIMLIGNIARISLFYRYIHWRIVGFYVLGLLPGAFMGIFVFQLLPKDLIKLMMGLFILLAACLPNRNKKDGFNEKIFTPVGLITGFVGIFVGATGPFTAPFYIRQGIVKESLIATKSTCQIVEHLLKVLLFGFIGINVLEFGSLIFGLGIAVVLGTMVGKKLLNRLSAKTFLISFKIILCLIALRIIVIQLSKIIG